MKSNSKFKYFISPIIVLFLLMIIFICNGVYPFGSHTIVNSDFGKAYVPIYYYIYDVLSGNANIFINFKVGMGSNMYDLTSIYGILSPLTWLIMFSSRSNIPNFLSYILIIKLCLLSVTSFLLFDRVYKNLDLFWKVLFSVFYALGIYTILYYTNFVWLDNIILFPLLLLGFKWIIERDNISLYTVVLFLSFSFSFYIAYMELLFILFLSFGYLFFICEKEKRKKCILYLGIGTFLSLGMASLFVGPVIFQTLSSIRIMSMPFVNCFFGSVIEKFLIIAGYGFPLFCFVNFLFSKKLNNKYKKFFIYIFFIVCIGVIFEPINLMWHTGSYIMFPFRYGFISVIVVYLGAMYYLSNVSILKFNYNLKFNFVIIGILFFLLILFFIFLIPMSVKSAILVEYFGNFQSLIVCLILCISFLLSLFIIYLNNIQVKKILICLLFGISFFGLSLGYIGISSNELNKDGTDESVFDAIWLDEFLNDNNDFNRYKDLNNDFISNYAFITDTSSIDSWKMVDFDSYKVLGKFGYEVNFSVSDKGGTLFSDNLLGINRVLSYKKLDSNLYKLLKSDKKMYLYELNNYLGYGILYDDFNKNYDYNDSIDFQNYVYKSLFNKEDDILEDVDFLKKDINSNKDICANKNGEINFYISVNELSNLYFNYDSISNNNTIKYIKVNDNYIYNSDIFDQERKSFDNNNGIIDLGLYDRGIIKVSVFLNSGVCLKKYRFVSLNINKFNELIEYNKSNAIIEQKDNSLIIKVDNKNDKDKLFLPLNYLNGYNCKLNGKEVSINKVFDNFVSIDLEKGNNKIILSYYPPNIKIFFLISIISCLLFVLSFKFNFCSNILLNLSMIVYYIVVIIMFFIIYIYGFIRLLL